MTRPTITFGHGFLDDLSATTNWVFNNTGLVSAAQSIQNGDILRLTGTPNDSGDEYCNSIYDLNLGSGYISTSVYKVYFLRWRTSVTGSGLGAIVYLDFSNDLSDSQMILPKTGSTPQYSTAWTVTTGTTTPGKTLKRILFYADDYPNTVGDGAPGIAYWVEFEFILISNDTFTFPNVGGGMRFTPPPRYSQLALPGRIGDITQQLGAPSATVTCLCDLDVGDWTRTADYINGEVFIDIAHNSKTEPWQWLDTGEVQMKVTLDEPIFQYDDEKHTVDLLFREYRLGTAASETYIERFGLNL